MKLSDRLVEARFTKRADGRWDYAPMPFIRRRILSDEGKAVFAEDLKALQPGFTLATAGFVLTLGTFPIAVAIVTMGMVSGSMNDETQRFILWVGLLPGPIGGLYSIVGLIRARNHFPPIRALVRNAEKGSRVGYFESLTATGKALGRAYTLLIIAACASALIFAGMWGFMTSSILEELIVPVIVIAALLPLFRSGLISRDPGSSQQ